MDHEKGALRDGRLETYMGIHNNDASNPATAHAVTHHTDGNAEKRCPTKVLNVIVNGYLWSDERALLKKNIVIKICKVSADTMSALPVSALSLP